MIDQQKIQHVKDGLRFNINAAENHGAKCTQLTADAETWRWLLAIVEMCSESACAECCDTGFYGDLGPGGAKHNNEYQPCDSCTHQDRIRRVTIKKRLTQCAT